MATSIINTHSTMPDGVRMTMQTAGTYTYTIPVNTSFMLFISKVTGTSNTRNALYVGMAYTNPNSGAKAGHMVAIKETGTNSSGELYAEPSILGNDITIITRETWLQFSIVYFTTGGTMTPNA